MVVINHVHLLIGMILQGEGSLLGISQTVEWNARRVSQWIISSCVRLVVLTYPAVISLCIRGFLNEPPVTTSPIWTTKLPNRKWMNVTFSKGQFSKSKWVRVFQPQHFSGDTSPKTNMTMENQPRMKMYFLLKIVFFQPVMLIFGCMMLVFWAHLLTEMGFKPPILEHFGAGVVGRIPIPGCGWWGGLCLLQGVVAMKKTDQIPQITKIPTR